MLLIIISINLILIVAVKKKIKKKKKKWLPLNNQVPARHQPLLPAAPQEGKN